MTNEELINSFPECEFIKKENIIECINSIFDKIKFYREIHEYIMDKCNKFYPRKENDKEFNKKRADYFYGSGYDEKYNYIDPFGDWIELIENEFISRNGIIREYEESAEIAAKKWIDLIYGFHIQDNGAINEDHGGGFASCALGTLLKNNTLDKLDKETLSKKTFTLIKEWYLNNRENRGYGNLSVDYGPSKALHEILVEAGVPERNTSDICPWKTMISIDRKDNCVLYHTYGHVDYI